LIPEISKSRPWRHHEIGQLFSKMDGGSPFDNLAKGIEPYPLAAILPVLETGIGCTTSEVFERIDEV